VGVGYGAKPEAADADIELPQSAGSRRSGIASRRELNVNAELNNSN
jgi:hypothetical protein